jgi:flagellar protein FlgJ
MMLESARSASLGSGLFDGPQTEQYFALMDRQVALELARSGGFGFGKMLERELAPREAAGEPVHESSLAPARSMRVTPPDSPFAPEVPAPAAPGARAEFPVGLPPTLSALGGAPPADEVGEPTPAQFVTALLPEAEKAAAALGIEPRLLLAQAALETGWGRSVMEKAGASAHNLFGIKADASWSGSSVDHWTREHVNGVTVPQRESFRAYGSAAESFADYVDLIGTARRYAGALEQGSSPEAYAHAVTKAGYATDPDYASKWLAIYHGDRLEQALRGIDLPQP